MTRQRTVLSEASGTARATESKGIWRMKLIAGDVAGSSGYYPASVLERDGSRAFPSGTHVYLDHPTLSEGAQRPERSARDLVGALIEDASYEDDPTDGKGLYAKVMFKESVREDVEFYARTAGMSIRAIGVHDESQDGELIVTELLEGISVDIVTHAGAGGKLVTMTESARKGQEPESMLFAQLSESDRNGMERLFAEIQELRSTISEMREATKAPEAPELSLVRSSPSWTRPSCRTPPGSGSPTPTLRAWTSTSCSRTRPSWSPRSATPRRRSRRSRRPLLRLRPLRLLCRSRPSRPPGRSRCRSPLTPNSRTR